MLHHERLRPPSRDYPADEWNIVEKGFRPEFFASLVADHKAFGLTQRKPIQINAQRSVRTR